MRPILCPLFGWIVWLLTRKNSQQRTMERAIEDFFGWFPSFVGESISFLLVNDVMIVLYIIVAGLVGLSIDAALSD